MSVVPHAASQPVIPGCLEFRLIDSIVIEQGGLEQAAIVNVPNTFTIRIDLDLAGPLAGLLVGEAFNVFLHTERLEDGDRNNPSGGTFNVPGVGPFSVTTRPFTTAEAGGPAADFQIPPGFDAGTFQVTVHLHFVDPSVNPIVAAFDAVFVEVENPIT